MEETILSLSTRPRSLSRLYGQEALVKSIRSHMSTRVPRVWLFTGPPGTGKTTIAGIMSVAFQCDHMKLWGDPCDDCWKRRREFSIHKINASKTSGIEELERVADLSRNVPMIGNKRVILLEEIQNISKQAWSMLLDPTEDAPETTVWILCTTELNKVPAANQRRCVKYQLKTLGISATEDFIKKMAVRAKISRSLDDLIEQVHLMNVDSPGVLLQALEKYAAGCSASEAVVGIDGAGINTYELCKQVTKGSWNGTCSILKEATPEQARLIRASVAGWIRGILIREINSAQQERAAASLIELSTPPWDDAMMLQWLFGVLYKICKRYRG